MTNLRRLFNHKQKMAEIKESLWMKACRYDNIAPDTSVRLAFVVFSNNNPFAVKYGKAVSSYYRKYDRLMNL